MKKLSCAVIIYNSKDEILMCHSTGNNFWDLPKGEQDPNETPEATARREFLEETGLNIEKYSLVDNGVFSYNKHKNIHVFICKERVDFNLDLAFCSTYFFDKYTNKKKLEVDDYKFFSKEEAIKNSAKSMSILLNKIL